MKVWPFLLLAAFVAAEIHGKDAAATRGDSRSLATAVHTGQDGRASLEAQLAVRPKSTPGTVNNATSATPLRRRRKTKHKSSRQSLLPPGARVPTIGSTAAAPTHAKSSKRTLSRSQVLTADLTSTKSRRSRKGEQRRSRPKSRSKSKKIIISQSETTSAPRVKTVVARSSSAAQGLQQPRVTITSASKTIVSPTNDYVASKQQQQAPVVSNVKNPPTKSSGSEVSYFKAPSVFVTTSPSSSSTYVPLRVTTKPPPPAQKHLSTPLANTAQHYGTTSSIIQSLPSTPAPPSASSSTAYCPCNAFTTPHTVVQHAVTSVAPGIHTGNIVRITTLQPQKPAVISKSKVLSSVDEGTAPTATAPVASVVHRVQAAQRRPSFPSESRGKSAYSYPSWTGESSEHEDDEYQSPVRTFTKVLGSVDTTTGHPEVSTEAVRAVYGEIRKTIPQPVAYVTTVAPKIRTYYPAITTTARPQVVTTYHPCPISTPAPVYHTTLKPQSTATSVSKTAHILRVTRPPQVQVVYKPTIATTNTPYTVQVVNVPVRPKVSQTSSTQNYKLTEGAYIQAMHHVHFESRKEASKPISTGKQKVVPVVLNVVQLSTTPKPVVKPLYQDIFIQKRPPAPTTPAPVVKVQHVVEQPLKVQKKPLIISTSTPSYTSSPKPVKSVGATVHIIIPQTTLTLPPPTRPTKPPPPPPTRPPTPPITRPPPPPTRPPKPTSYTTSAPSPPVIIPVIYESMKIHTTPCPVYPSIPHKHPVPVVPVTSPKPYVIRTTVQPQSHVEQVSTSLSQITVPQPIRIAPLPPKVVAVPSRPTHVEHNEKSLTRAQHQFRYEVHTRHQQPQKAVLSQVQAPSVATKPVHMYPSTTLKPATVLAVQYHQPPQQVITVPSPAYQQPQQVQAAVKPSTTYAVQKSHYDITLPQPQYSHTVTTNVAPKVHSEAVTTTHPPTLPPQEESHSLSLDIRSHGHPTAMLPCPLPILVSTPRPTPAPVYNPVLVVSATPAPVVVSKQVVLSEVQQPSTPKYEETVRHMKSKPDSSVVHQFYFRPTPQESLAAASYVEQKPHVEPPSHVNLVQTEHFIQKQTQPIPVVTPKPHLPAPPLRSFTQVHHESWPTSPIYANTAQSYLPPGRPQTPVLYPAYPTHLLPQMITRNLAELMRSRASHHQVPAQAEPSSAESEEQQKGDSGSETPPPQVNYVPIRVQPIIVQGPNQIPHYEPPPNLPPGYGYNKGIERVPPTPPPYEFKRIVPQAQEHNNELARKLRSPSDSPSFVDYPLEPFGAQYQYDLSPQANNDDYKNDYP